MPKRGGGGIFSEQKSFLKTKLNEALKYLIQAGIDTIFPSQHKLCRNDRTNRKAAIIRNFIKGQIEIILLASCYNGKVRVGPELTSDATEVCIT